MAGERVGNDTVLRIGIQFLGFRKVARGLLFEARKQDQGVSIAANLEGGLLDILSSGT